LSAIFLSHSSSDNVIAGVVSAALAQQGHRAVFLDFDAEQGIPAGRDWEKTLYAELRGCRVVIVLCSAHSMASPWCFAEITHARALGKALFPVKVSACEVHPLLKSVQVTDLTMNKDEGFARLWGGLKAAGLDPADSFDWDGSRPPYPGLLAFEEKDAAIFFGRDKEIREALDTLSRQQRFGGARFALLLGASGSGKSSLLRAGVIPRLRRNPEQWLVVWPFRPHGRPFDNLADALSLAFQSAGKADAARAVRERLGGPDAGAALVELVRDLRLAAGRLEATVLVCVDQLEELFTLSGPEEAGRFLAALRGATEPAGSPVLVAATLRSDFLGQLQTQPALRDMSLVELLVNPMPLQAVGEIIEGPATVASLDLEAGLTQAMIQDTEAADALPLLAFTLRELWEKRNGTRLELAVYRDQLGGLTGSVARAAEAVLGSGAALTETQEGELRQAFLSMVRVNDAGQFTRFPAVWADLPEQVHSVLERFVQARLLVSGQRGKARILEVAHEALFRSWDRLRAWLQENREFLLWRERLRGALSEWERSVNDEGALLRGAVLTEAVNWTTQRPGQLSANERTFIEASADLRQRERQAAEAQRAREIAQARALADEQRMRADQEAKSSRNLRRLVIGLAVLTIGVFVAFAYAWRASTLEGEARRVAVARLLATEAKAALDSSNGDGAGLRRSLLLATESLRSSWTAEGFETWSQVMQIFPRAPTVIAEAGAGPFHAATLSPDGNLLAVAGDERISLLDVRTWKERASLPQRAVALAFASPDGKKLASSDGSNIVIWDVEKRQPQEELKPDCKYVRSLALDTLSRWLVSAGSDYHACVFELGNRTQIGKLNNYAGRQSTHSVAFFPGHDFVLTGGSFFKGWKSPTASEPEFSIEPGGVGSTLAFSKDGQWLATSTGLLQFDLSSADLGLRSPRWIEHWGEASAVSLEPDGRLFAVARSQTVWIRAVEEKPDVSDEVLRFPIDDPKGVSSVTFVPAANGQVIAGDKWLLTAGDDLKRWSLNSGADYRRFQFDAPVEAVATSPDPNAHLLVTTTKNGAIQVRDTIHWGEIFNGEVRPRDGEEEAPSVMAFSVDARWLAATSGKTFKVFSTAEWRELARGELPDVISGVGFTPDHRYLIVDSHHLIRVTRTDSWQSADLQPNAGNGVLFGARTGPPSISPDGTMLAVRYDPRCQRTIEARGSIFVWQIADGQQIASLPLGREALTAELTRELRRCRGITPQFDDAVQGTGRIEVAQESAKWAVVRMGDQASPKSPDGRLTVNKLENSASLEIANGSHPIATMKHDAAVTGAAFTLDGRWLVTTSRDRTARVWALRSPDLIDQTCARVTRNLPKSEWRRLRGDEPYVPTCPLLPAPDE
jgi:WD40 repeat protein